MKKISVDNMILVLKSKYGLEFSNLTWSGLKIEASERHKINTQDAYALDIVADIKELMLERIERNWYKKEERVFYINTLLEEFFKISGFPIQSSAQKVLES